MDLNVKSPFFLTKALAKPLRAAATPIGRRRSSTSAPSTASSSTRSETYSYPASKAAVIHLTRRMAHELVKENIDVTAIAPARSSLT